MGRIRYLTCSIIWLTLFTFYAMRSNISIALLSMTKQVISEDRTTYSSCIVNDSHSRLSQSQEYEFNWTQSQQGNVLASFFIGYFSTHFIGATASYLIGPRWVMIICLLGSTIFTYMMLLLPYWGVKYMIIGRIMIGVFSGPLYPVVHQIVAHYAPIDERTILTVVTHTGNIIGLCVNFVVGGYIVEHYSKGWRILFLLNGILGTICLILCGLFLYSSPKKNPMMSIEEKKLILGDQYEVKQEHSLRNVPLFSIMTSPKVVLIYLAQLGHSMIFYAQLTGYPKYMVSVFGLSKIKASFISIIPFLSNFFAQILYPLIFDLGRMKGRMSTTTYRRLSSAIAFTGAVSFLIPVGFIPCSLMSVSILLVTLSMVSLAANQAGFFTAMIDISPCNVGFIMSFASMFGSLSGILQPLITAYFTKSGDIKDGYKLSFIVTAAISIIMGVPFLLFGSSEEIHWGEEQKKFELLQSDQSA